MSRVHAIPFRVRVQYRRGPNGTTTPERWHSFKTMAGLIEYRADVLRKPLVYKVETFVLIDETSPNMPQEEPDMRTQVVHNGGERRVVTHSNIKRGART